MHILYMLLAMTYPSILQYVRRGFLNSLSKRVHEVIKPMPFGLKGYNFFISQYPFHDVHLQFITLLSYSIQLIINFPVLSYRLTIISSKNFDLFIVIKKRLTAVGTRCANHVTPLYPQKLALTSPTGGGRSVRMVRSRTKSHGVN